MSEVVLPEGWAQCLLGDVVNYGKTEKIKIDDVELEDWILELEDIEKSSSKLLARVSVEERPFKSTKNIFQKGDVLYGKLRPYLNKVILADRNGICSTEIIPINAEPFIYNPYLFHWLKSGVFQAYVNSVSYGVNMPRLGTKDGNAAPLVLAPVAEQKEIAARLDNLLAQVDSIKTRLDAIPAILKRFRQSVLAAAVSGKLTEEWRREIQSIEIVDSGSFLDEELKDVDANEHMFTAPDGWAWVRFGSQVKLINGDRGKNYPNKAEYVSRGLPFINTGHINPNGTLSLDRMNYITRDKFDSLGSGKVQQGDLVYCLRGATMGKTAIVDPISEGAIASSLVIVRTRSNLNHKFAYLFLTSPQGKELIDRFDNGSAQPNLSAKSVGLYPLALPSKEEQTEIVHRVEQLFAYADQIEQRVKDAQTRVNNLTQSILVKAFRGELTADWREQHSELISAENSAQALLEKIKEQQAELTKASRKKRTKKS